MDRFEARVERAHTLLAEAAALLLRHGEEEESSTSRSSQGEGASDGDERSSLQAALDAFETALVLAPHLRPVAWEYGVALLYTGRLRAAADQFACCAALDRDDCEPWLWRFLCIARLEGLEAARASLAAWKGYDARLCMMEALELFKGKATLDEVLAGASGDRHSTARASFASALYFEARGEGHLALPLLQAVAGLDGEGGSDFLRGLARCHIRVLEARLRQQAAAEERLAAAPASLVAAGKGKAVKGEGGGEEKGARPFGAAVAGAWGGMGSLASNGSTASLTSSEETSTSSLLSLSSSLASCCFGSTDSARPCFVGEAERGPRLSPVHAEGAAGYWD